MKKFAVYADIPAVHVVVDHIYGLTIQNFCNFGRVFNFACVNFTRFFITYIHTLLCSSKRLFNTNLHGMVIIKQG